MSDWKDWVQGESLNSPGCIKNRVIMDRIKQQRRKYGNPKSDEDLGLADKKDFYILSVGFFKFYYDTFGCD